MRMPALFLAVATALTAAPSAAHAFLWDFPDWAAAAGAFRHHPGQPEGGPSVVVGWGDEPSPGQSSPGHQRYWGGPVWVDCPGYHPPYQSWPVRGRTSCRRAPSLIVK